MSARDQGFQLAMALDAAADAIKSRLHDDWHSLKPSQRKELEDAFWDTLSNAMRIRTAAVDRLLRDAETDLQALTRLTGQAQRLVRSLDDVRAAIKMATAIFSLAAAVAAAVAAPNQASVVAAARALQAAVAAAEG